MAEGDLMRRVRLLRQGTDDPMAAARNAALARRPAPRHGTITNYQNGCHCTECRAVSAAARARTRAQHKTKECPK